MGHYDKGPRRPLEDAFFFINAAQQILLRLYHRKSYPADEYDFALLQRIAETCNRTCLIAKHTEICLHQRREGEPESPLPPGYDNK